MKKDGNFSFLICVFEISDMMNSLQNK